jgi:hypothetical protein
MRCYSMGMSVQYAEMKSGSDGFVENSFVVAGPDLGPIPPATWEAGANTRPLFSSTRAVLIQNTP